MLNKLFSLFKQSDDTNENNDVVYTINFDVVNKAGTVRNHYYIPDKMAAWLQFNSMVEDIKNGAFYGNGVITHVVMYDGKKQLACY